MASTLSSSTTVSDAARVHGFHDLAVKEVVEETADTRTYVLDTPPELLETFRYEPGQFCTFRVHVGGGEQLRSYSMSSTPETDPDLAVTVKRVPDGLVSNWFHDHIRQGDVLETTKPAGVFCLRDNGRPVVAFCGGSGITPVMSIAKRTLVTTDRPVTLLYANRCQDSVIFADQLADLQARFGDRLRVKQHVDADAGLLDAATVAGFAREHVGGADFYLCGPTPFMDLVEHTLLDLGVQPDRVLLERFGTSGPSSSAAAAVGPAASADPADEVPSTVTLVVKGKPHELTYVRGDTVLETARRGALATPYSCEAGNCATCMAVLRDGTATMHVNNALTPDEVADGWILTCQSVLRGPTATVEFEAL